MGEVKREQECNTTDDWRHRAYHLESEWARCSQACAVMQAERDALRKDFDAALTECKLLTHKVLTCGVAASHPDANLAHTGAYKEKWDSPQAEEVRKLRAERDTLAAEVAQSDADYQDAVTLAQMNKDRLDAALAEVAKLRAACAAKDEAICTLRDHITVGMYRAVPHLADVAASALSDDAGKNYVDASGAVESHCYIYVHEKYPDGPSVVRCRAPDSWAGTPVLIIPKPKE